VTRFASANFIIDSPCHAIRLFSPEAARSRDAFDSHSRDAIASVAGLNGGNASIALRYNGKLNSCLRNKTVQSSSAFYHVFNVPRATKRGNPRDDAYLQFNSSGINLEIKQNERIAGTVKKKIYKVTRNSLPTDERSSRESFSLSLSVS